MLKTRKTRSHKSTVGLEHGRIAWDNSINALSVYWAKMGLSADIIASKLLSLYGVSLTRGQIYTRVWKNDAKMGDYRQGKSLYSQALLNSIVVVNGNVSDKKKRDLVFGSVTLKVVE